MRTEFQFLGQLQKKYNLTFSGDDCAVLPKNESCDQVISADMLVEDIDFRLKWTMPEFLGEKALNVSLSDIAAMGARPVYSMLSLAIPDHIWNSDLVDKFYDGYMKVARKFDVELIGGDISKTDGKFTIDSVVIGEVAKGEAILRSGAKPGNSIYVTGDLGNAAGGLILLEQGERYDNSLPKWKNDLIISQLAATHRPFSDSLIQLKPFITSMIDISDGLLADLSHICEASQTGAELTLKNIPVAADLSNLNITDDQKLDLALSGGEDFRLLFTIDEKKFSGQIPAEFHHLGDITQTVGNITLKGSDNSIRILPKGYTHF